MGLMSDLGYEAKEANLAQRGVQAIASTRPGAWLFQRMLYPMDKLSYRFTHGSTTVASLVGGLPVIMLTTTGARSGKSRSMPLMGFPLGDSLSILGTNYGQTPTPGWVYNLQADPAAVVSYRDRRIDVTARPASEEEAEETFRLAATVYSGYRKYRSRADGREIHVFVLDAIA